MSSLDPAIIEYVREPAAMHLGVTSNDPETAMALELMETEGDTMDMYIIEGSIYMPVFGSWMQVSLDAPASMLDLSEMPFDPEELGFGGTYTMTQWLDLAEYEGEFLSWYPLFAVPFGLLLGAAVIATLRAAGHRAPIPLVLVASVIVGLMLYAVPGFLGTQPAQQAAGEECSTEEVALFEGLSLYDDLDQKPTGTLFGSCYVGYTIDGTGQQAWVDLSRLRVDNG